MAVQGFRPGPGALVALLVVAGCNVQVVAPPKKDKPAVRATPAGAQAPAKSATADTASKLGAAPRAAVLLAPPPGENARLQGTVTIDANYLVAAGAGNVISQAGGPLVAAGAGNLVGPDGASLVGPDGATLVAAGGGNVVASEGLNLVGPDGASLIGPDGASLVGPDGASLVGADGGSLVGADGGSLVGADGASFRLAQAFSPAATLSPAVALSPARSLSPAVAFSLAQAPSLAPAQPAARPPLPALGQLLPAAAMRVGLIDLRDGKPLAVGVDGDGKPVYTVYSNLAGRFELFVPAALKDYVRVVAEAPGKPDARLRYDSIVRADEEPDDVDEDTARVGRFLRAAFAARFEQLMMMTKEELQGELEADRPLNTGRPEYFQTLAKPLLLFFGEMSSRRGFPRMDPVRRRAIAQAAADRVLAACDFTNVTTADLEPLYHPKDPNERALDAFRDAMKRIRTDVKPLLEAEGSQAFSLRLAKLTATLKPDGTPLYPIAKPADVTTLIVQKYLARRPTGTDIGPEAAAAAMHEVVGLLNALGILSDEDRSGRLSAAGRAVIYHMLYVFNYKDNPDPATIKYGPVGQGVIDYLWTVETGVAGDLGRPSPAPAAASRGGT